MATTLADLLNSLQGQRLDFQATPSAASMYQGVYPLNVPSLAPAQPPVQMAGLSSPPAASVAVAPRPMIAPPRPMAALAPMPAPAAPAAPTVASAGPPPQSAPNDIWGAIRAGLHDHSNALIGLGTGLLSANNFADGLAAGGQNYMAGAGVDQKARQQNVTSEYLKKSYPDLAVAVANGMPISQAFAQIAQQESQKRTEAFQAGLAPPGYRRTASGMEPIPGGPADPDNPLNLHRITAAAGADPNDTTADDIAGAIERGEQPPNTTGLYKYGAAVRANLAQKGFDLSTANEDWTATQKHLASLNSTQQVRLRQAVDFSSQSAGLVDELAEQWKGSQFPLLNKANLAAAKSGVYGQAAASLATRLSASIADLTSELGTVYKGGNSSTDESLKLAATNLNEDWSTDTIKDATAQIRKSLTYRQNSLKSGSVAGIPSSRYDPGQGVAPDAPTDAPPAAAAPAAPVQTQAMPGEQTATNPQTGQRVVLRNGQWVPL